MQQNVFVEYILWTTRNLQLDELELVPNGSMKMYVSKVVEDVQKLYDPSCYFYVVEKGELNSWVIIGVSLQFVTSKIYWRVF